MQYWWISPEYRNDKQSYRLRSVEEGCISLESGFNWFGQERVKLVVEEGETIGLKYRRWLAEEIKMCRHHLITTFTE